MARQRTKDLELMSRHKYGEQVVGWGEYLRQLGEAVVKVDLLHVKPGKVIPLDLQPTTSGRGRHTSCKVNLEVQPRASVFSLDLMKLSVTVKACPYKSVFVLYPNDFYSSIAKYRQGAAFVLYNCARLAAIRKQFDDKVAEGYYPHLIPLQDVDFSLLKQETEPEASHPHLRNAPHPIILPDFLLVAAPGRCPEGFTQREAKSLSRLSYVVVRRLTFSEGLTPIHEHPAFTGGGANSSRQWKLAKAGGFPICPEEWTLLCKHLLFYPNILENSVRDVESGIIEPQLLSRFLMSLCANFSIYYRRVRILTEPRNHLLPVMFARLYLLKGIEQVLHNALKIMDI
ncbi:unnamed protein product, partial [Timema podura]|nr:unnamed protein product [Timema podura]